MRDDLANWQARLAQHFTALQGQRCGDTPRRTVFALEHGLDLSEVHDLAGAVRSQVSAGPPSRLHPLPWIVYSAEIGYGYSGDEYWQTFEQKTPGWTVHGDRYWIRDCYRSFQKNFLGAFPTGAWAEHFSIICWPITHAILPRDLQRQLARILYDLRHSFSAELFESPSTLGEFIAARSWNATSRFRNLVQETLLVGQIAAALLLQGDYGTAGLVHPKTLKRISDDLERERQAREWLRGARRFAQERAQVRGLALRRGTTLPLRRAEEARAEIAALGIEPRLVLRPTDPQRASWQVSIQIPDLAHLLLRFPKTRDILTSSRCVVAGALGRPLARGRCLHGAQRVILKRWPRSDEVLLHFEATDAQLEYLLRTECLLRPGPTWLFRVGSDGLAYELRGLRVRPNSRYILISMNETITTTEHARAVHLECEGVFGAMLDLPPALNSDWETELRFLGLGVSKAIDVWPAGLTAAAWDGEGHGEWLASERPCLGICSDHPIAAITVSMGTHPDQSVELTPVVPGEPIFIELPELPIGLHTVRVCTRGLAGQAESLGDLDVVMRIREARPWSPGISPQGPLLVQLDPATPTMEQLWEGRASVSLGGPIGRLVKCKVSFLEQGDQAPTFTVTLPRIPLPVTPDGWTAHFEKHFSNIPKAQAAYDTARACELVFTAEELGGFTVHCEREFAPLRWVVRRVGHDYVVRLLDDSGSSTHPIVGRISFESPLVEEKLEFAADYKVPASGGLYCARLGDLTAAIIAPPTVTSLTDLRCAPQMDGPDRSIESVLRALPIARLWHTAKLPGLFSRTRQRDVLSALARHIFRVLCGENWARAEAYAHDRNDGLAGLKDAVSRRREEAAIGIVLARDCAAIATVACEHRISRLATLAEKFLSLKRVAAAGVADGDMIVRGSTLPPPEKNSQWLSELALRLASDPATVEAWAGPHLRDGITALLELPTLARAARFLVLATDRHLESRAAAGELYAGWEWR